MYKEGSRAERIILHNYVVKTESYLYVYVDNRKLNTNNFYFITIIQIIIY